jgi:hypothetical protein
MLVVAVVGVVTARSAELIVTGTARVLLMVPVPCRR